MFVLVLRTLFGVLVAWVFLGALIGIAAALWKRVPVPGGVFVGALLGPLAFLMFFVPADNINKEGDFNTNASRYARRCCPVCPEPNDLLIWQGSSPTGPRFGDFVEPLPKFMHYYRCRVCRYKLKFESFSMDPDTGPGPKYL